MYGLKRCASVLRCNTKSGKSVRFYTKRKSGRKPPHIRPSPKQDRSESQCSCIFQGLTGTNMHMGLRVKYALKKSSCASKITPVRSKNRTRTVSVFLSNFQLTTLRLKSFRLRLHCYTLTVLCRPGRTQERKKEIPWGRQQTCAKTNLLHLECHLILISNLNVNGLFSTKRGKRDLKN